MISLSSSKQEALFLKLEKAILEKDKSKIEKCLLGLEKELANGLATNNDKIKLKLFNLLGLGCLMVNRFTEAQSLLLSQITLLENGEELDHIALFYAQYNLGEVYYQQNLYEEAELRYLNALSLSEIVKLSSDIDIPHLLRGLSLSCHGQKKYNEAEQYARRELVLREQSNCVIYDCVMDLGYICFALEKYEEAEAFFIKGLGLLEPVIGSADKKKLAELNAWKESILEHLVDTYTSLFQFDKAQVTFEKLKAFNPKTKFILPFCKINSSEESSVDSSLGNKRD